MTRKVKVGRVTIGGGSPIAIQSMSTFNPVDTEYAAAQINALHEAGADIVRVAVPDRKAAEALGELRRRVNVPLVADIHFDYRLALTAMESGIDALRINPGNIGRRENVVKVVDMAKEKHIPIRIGINAGSLPADILGKFGGHPTAEGMVEGAMSHVRILEEEDFHDIVISVKSTDVPMMVKANRLLHEKVDYPLHLGVTEAGTLYRGTIKSAIGIGALLLDGIGDTIRVSLTDDPVKEVKAAKEILSSVGMRQYGPVLVSCPTCGRTQVNLIEMAQEVEKKIEHFRKPIRVAVMGCAVNGPGEAREADFGIAGGKGSGLLFRKGKVIRSVPEAELIDALMEEIETFENEGE
ncbi:flavodoxin-dependent (E)-4-hydroxy-3-methylbut-2-enyl-diphosphate synthase [Dialister sp.]|uniref:flavodoxin-dependent (E)-4-hydroxy-3-methylbut-2-enyl-diphosphate synthase n=1 Tax=Dialister sp. TaxID=1955814 RepID=UPI002E80F980|nr:flavodoxin-dependent (E)-4-hydroxy-3-methylbut-2-enyl-diphosphate synthase [Dialister sp.]MEE3452160.1 flavodoxin-dependent (E)-4-hydroxy-3-methylbut-2-enyl-diphosphate synthase [Dialister sp.]